jgi:hypothetical protein
MKIKTFWIFLLKILGLYFVLGSIDVIAQFVSSIYYLLDNSSDVIVKTSVIGMVTTMIIIYLLVLRLFVFKPNLIIDKLKLDQGFDEEKIELNNNSTSILRIAIIVIGGLILVNNLPVLCKNIFVFLQQQAHFKDYPETGWIIFGVIKSIIGYLLLTNNLYFADLIKNKKTE